MGKSLNTGLDKGSGNCLVKGLSKTFFGYMNFYTHLNAIFEFFNILMWFLAHVMKNVMNKISCLSLLFRILEGSIELLKPLDFPTLSTRSQQLDNLKLYVTSMHSSRMRTACLLLVSPSMHCSQGVYLLGWCTCPGGVPAQGGVPGGFTCQGVYLVWGGVPAGWSTCPGGCVPVRGCTCPGGCTYPGVVGGTCPGTPPVDKQTRVKT